MPNKNLIKAALGNLSADFVIKNGIVANVFTGQFIQQDVLVKDGYICGVGEYDCDTVIDASGKYVLPGFIDSHLHIESSMVTPHQYANAAVPHGITTVIADPHEITNVCGRAGLEFMKKSAEGLPIDIKYMLPSCVPATPFEHSGAVLTAADTQELAPDFFGIGEMMNYPGVLACDEETHGKLTGGNIDGHAPMLSGKELDAYISAGIKTDHECGTISEMHEKISKGMYVAIREGTLSKDLSRLTSGINAFNYHRCIFCTDDRFIGEITSDGSVDYMIKKSIAAGLDPIMAICIATINAAACYGIKNTGAIAPGYKADIVIADNLNEMNICSVYKNGRKVAENEKMVYESSMYADTSQVTDTVHLPEITAEFFAHNCDEDFPAIELIPDAIITKKVTAKHGDKLSKVCVIERHNNTGNKGIGYVTNYGITGGAIATSIGHDSHNVIVIGDNDSDMACAVNALGTSGGICVVSNNEIKEYLELEIAGLMTNKKAEDVSVVHDRLLEEAYKLGVTHDVDPLLSLAFLPLPVIPEIRITDSGLFDVIKFDFI